MATYTKTTFVNGASPAINASELNKIGDGILEAINFAEGLDGRISALETSIGSSGNIGSTVASSLSTITWDDTAKKLTKTRNNGTTSDVFTASELRSDMGLGSGTGALGVGYGGTGTNSFTSGALLTGNGAGAITTTNVYNRTNVGYFDYSNNRAHIPNVGSISFWNGAYNADGTSNLSYLGTVTKGVWNGTVIGVSYGGTGKTALTGSNSLRNALGFGTGTGALAIACGGTGKTTASEAWTALGGGSIGKLDSLSESNIPNLPASKITSGTLPLSRGGTGATDASAARSNLGAAASSHTHSFSDVTSGTLILRSTANYGTSLPSSATTGQIFFKY